MPEGHLYNRDPQPPDDPYAAFVDIFGRSPGPGRTAPAVPQRQASHPLQHPQGPQMYPQQHLQQMQPYPQQLQPHTQYPKLHQPMPQRAVTQRMHSQPNLHAPPVSNHNVPHGYNGNYGHNGAHMFNGQNNGVHPPMPQHPRNGARAPGHFNNPFNVHSALSVGNLHLNTNTPRAANVSGPLSGGPSTAGSMADEPTLASSASMPNVARRSASVAVGMSSSSSDRTGEHEPWHSHLPISKSALDLYVPHDRHGSHDRSADRTADRNIAGNVSAWNVSVGNISAGNVSSNSGNSNPGNSSPGSPGMPRSVSQVWSGLKKQVIIQRSASATMVSGKPVTKGGRAIPTRSDLGAFVNHGAAGGSNGIHNALADTLNSSANHGLGINNVSSGDESDMMLSQEASSATISSLGGRSAIVAASSRREPLVYPALLGRVAQKFRERMAPVLGDRVKNELTYKNAFTGSEAVDVIAYIIKTPDRNLALLLGRSLDAQKLFHDVTYDNRLRDSHSEIYQFSTSDENCDTISEPNGVFTLLSECYSPTCSRNRLCYSISCPRRLEQQARLNMKLDPGLLSQHEDASMTLNDVEDTTEKLWRYNVPPQVVEATLPTEQKRQEAIAELIYTERQFVKSLEYLRESWIKPLRRSTILGPERRRDKFIRMVFLNILEVHAVNLKFAEALTRRQQIAPIVNQIADVVLEYVPRFDPFVTYGSQQMYAKYEFEKECALNPAFARFVHQTERDPESQQLELNGYLTKPTTRLARYPLLLDAIVKRTEKDNPDAKNIPEAIEQIRQFLFRVNAESGKAENRFTLHQLNQALTFRAGEYVDLHLLDPKRQLVFKGHLYKRPPPGEGNVQVYLFDHAILFAKRKKVSGMSSTAAAAAAAAAAAVEPSTCEDDGPGTGREVLRVNSKPIPLQLLQLADSEEIGRRKAAAHMIRTTVSRNADGKTTYPITFQHLGRRGYEVTLYAENFQARKTWVETVLKQQEAQRLAANVFTLHTLYTSNSVSGRAQCSALFDGGKRALFGTDRGIYLSVMTYQDADGRFNPVSSSLKMILSTTSPITQLDVVDKYGIVLMLSDKNLSTFSIDLIDHPSEANRKLKVIANQVTFYKVDEYLGQMLLTVVKSNNLNSTIRVLEPAGPAPSSQKRPPLKRLLTSANSGQSDGFKVVKPPIEIPSATLSLSFLRNHLCLGCSRGFEILDLEKGKFESLLDPADTSLDFVIKRESLKPISLYRIGKEFLLNYSDFSFFINRNGWRSRPDWIIQWECTPQRIILSYPYLVAFDHSMIEIRNMGTELLRIIQGESIRFLHESTHDILYAVENERGQDEVVSINFWEKQQVPKKDDD